MCDGIPKKSHPVWPWHVYGKVFAFLNVVPLGFQQTELFAFLNLAVDECITLYYSIYLGKVYKLLQSKCNKTSYIGSVVVSTATHSATISTPVACFKVPQAPSWPEHSVCTLP